MADEFPGLVQHHFGFLEANGYHITEATVAEVFDNAYVAYWSPRLVIGVGRERGQCYFEVGAPGTSLYDGHLLSEFLHDTEGASLAAHERPSLSDLAVTLRRQLPTLEKAFSAECAAHTERALKQAGEMRATKLFGWPASDAPAT